MNESILPNRLIEMVALLTPSEKKALPHWLTAEFEGKKKSARSLCELLLAGTEEKDIAEKVKPGKILNRSQLRKLSDELIGAIKKFLALKQIGDNPNILDVNFLQLLLNRNELSLFPKIFKESQRRNVKLSPEDEGYYRYLHKMKKLSLSYGLLSGQSTAKLDWQRLADSMETAMTFEYLETMLTVATVRYQKGFELQMKLESTFLAHLDNEVFPGLNHLPLLFIYKCLYQGLNGEEIPRKEIWEAYKKIAKDLPFDSANNLYRIFQNQVVRDAVKQEKKELFELVYQMINWASKELRLVVDKLLARAIMGYVTILVELSERKEEKEKWIRESKLKLKELCEKLPNGDKEEIYTYGVAKISFLEERYDEILNPGNMATILDPTTSIQYQFLMQQIYYERGESERIIESLRTLKKRIEYNRGLFTSSVYQELSKGQEFFLKLMMARSKREYLILKEALAGEPYFRHKFWIKEKIDTLLR